MSANHRQKKKKNMLIRIIYLTSVATAIVASSVVAVLSSVTVPPLAVTCVSSIATLSSALSIKLNLKDRKNKLEKSIRKLHKIKDKLDFVIIYSPFTNEQTDRQTDRQTYKHMHETDKRQ